MNFIDYLFKNKGNSNKIAICNADGNSYTYKKLYDSIISLANYINENIDDKNILIFSETSFFSIVTLLAIIKSGHIAVPLSLTISDNELHYISETCNTKTIFCEKQNIEKFNFHFNTYDESIMNKLKTNTKSNLEYTNSSHPILILFTSGSTSYPKGVVLTNNNLISAIDSIHHDLSIANTDNLLLMLPFYHCYGLNLIGLLLRSFGTITLNKSSLFSPQLINDLKKHSCTTFAGVPSSYSILFKNPNFSNSILPNLKTFICASGMIPKNFYCNLSKKFPKPKVFNVYGQTEATGAITISNSYILSKFPDSIGIPAKNVTIKILNSNNVEISPGEIGEIVVYGNHVMKSYYLNDESTKTTLLNGALFTGDLATIDNNNNIYYKGRKKRIIKSSGYRISPTEIENVINEIPQVKEVSIVGIPDSTLGEAIKAFIVLQNDCTSLSSNYIIDFCKTKLPNYKVPKFISLINEIPKNSMGKILYKDLI